ncbi:Topoisomerase 1-associated factor 1 [Coemansia sp. Benny D115]|nr:Topoisomerase 1-associated factor 1 [Coemansia sp. Benny D115]
MVEPMEYSQVTEEEDHYVSQLDEAAISEEIARYRSIVLSACSSLGGLEPDTRQPGKSIYVPSADCLGSLKDIKRYIQMDEQGEGKLVLQWLGEWQVLERDIIPVFIHYASLSNTTKRNKDPEDDDSNKAMMLCIELFVFLTWSMETETEEVRMRFIRVLRSYKRAFAGDAVVKSLVAVLVGLMKRGVGVLDDRNWMLAKACLYVFRNVLAIPDPLVAPGTAGFMAAQVEVQDSLIAALDRNLAIDLFLTLASASATQPRLKELRPTLLDIVYYLFYRVPVSALFDKQQSAWFSRSSDAKSSRHNNFGGVYAVSTGEGTIMPVFSAKEVLRPFANLFRKRARVQRPKEAEGVEPPVDRQWRTAGADAIKVLRRVAAVFIESCYNPFVEALFEDARLATTIMDTQMPRLLYVSAYFVDVSLANPAIELGCTCVLVQTRLFGHVMRTASSYAELKSGSGLESAMYCIEQVLLALSRMRAGKLESLADNVLSNLFYDGDALDLFVKLCRIYRPLKHSRAFLEQVVQLTETFLGTLREYAASKSSMVVKKRTKKKVPREPKPESSSLEDGAMLPEDSGAEEAEEVDDDAIGDESAEVEDVEERLVEREFSMARYESAFAVADVVKCYSHLLCPPTATEYVYPMLRRIAQTSRRPQLFFKKPVLLRLLVLFDDQYNYPKRSEMIDLAAWIFRQYVTVINSPALKQHFKPDVLDNQMAMQCMLAFLKNSGMGKSVEPVITKHLVNLKAEGDAEKETEPSEVPLDGKDDLEAGARTTSVPATPAPVPAMHTEIRDEDLDFYGEYADDFDFDTRTIFWEFFN